MPILHHYENENLLFGLKFSSSVLMQISTVNIYPLLFKYRGDRTQPVHILGKPDQQPHTPAPERGMTPAGTALMRCLLHLSMYLGANQHTQVHY